MPTYYDDEEGDSPPYMSPDTIELVPGVDMGTGQMTGSPTPFYSPEQAAARSELLSQALPPTVGVSPQAGLIGEATKAYRSGVPGLFVQGGPSVPAGMIEVNGQLERSQAAPQPVPWWITSADQFKEQRRQEDFLKSLVAQAGPAGTQAINRANRLAAQFNLQNDIRSGVPLRDALAKNPGVFENAPAALARVAAIRPAAAPFTPTQTVLGGKTYTQVSPRRFVREKEEAPGLSKSQELAYIRDMTKVAAKNLEDATTAGDKTAMANAQSELIDLKQQADELRGRSKPKAQQTQTSPRVALASRLASEHPDWAKEKIIEEVRKQLK